MNSGGNHAVIAILPIRDGGRGAVSALRLVCGAGVRVGVVVAGAAAALSAACMFGFDMAFLFKL